MTWRQAPTADDQLLCVPPLLLLFHPPIDALSLRRSPAQADGEIINFHKSGEVDSFIVFGGLVLFPWIYYNIEISFSLLMLIFS